MSKQRLLDAGRCFRFLGLCVAAQQPFHRRDFPGGSFDPSGKSGRSRRVQPLPRESGHHAGLAVCGGCLFPTAAAWGISLSPAKLQGIRQSPHGARSRTRGKTGDFRHYPGEFNQRLMPSLTEIMRRQKKRVRTLIRAFRRANVDDRYRVVQGVCTRLPLPLLARQRVSSWCLDRITGRTWSARPADVRPAQKAWDKQGRARLRQFLQGGEPLVCPVVENPTVSFIVVLHNRAHLSLLSLESVIANANVRYELIVIDNASSDETGQMLDRLQGAKVIRNPNNVGFGPACMQATACAAGEYLCFFNNDALLSPTAISAALANFAHASVGAVGGKILLANGALQEAGNIVWSDGSALGYGRGDDPQAPPYEFRRPVDYCSAVFLLTPRRLFAELGGFSSEFAPAYYEDTDYCMTLWQRGFQVIYEPLAVIRHYESATSGGNEFAQARMAEHQKKFLHKWSTVLQRHYAPGLSPISEIGRAHV